MENRSFKSQLKYSDKFNSRYTAFIGDNEKNTNLISIRDNSTNEKFTVNEQDLTDLIIKNKGRVRCIKK